MPSTVSDVVFSEPSGRLNAAVMFSGALAFAGLYVYSRMTGTGSVFSWHLIMLVGFVLSGIAESLPADRQRAAGVFRIAAILLLLTILVPGFILGEP
ncbi:MULTISPECIES: hypothetical protein [Halobacteriales]|uniref:Uncharacterized protein n=1 Tax=Halopenitus malekzadehii TaxID=1267564 RepID=A0A1H6J5P1_9EURY|nr:MULTISPECIES: hypothetical protein [Halobacteria]SEH54144.1 hypothetical protein SAMN05192561_105148 [Halopenitus malekzadehii]